MIKNKKSFIVIITVLFAAVAALSAVSTLYAYDIYVNYNYNFNENADTLGIAYGASGTDQTLSVVETDNNISTQTVDIIAVSSASDVTVSGISPSYTVPYVYAGAHYYRMVFENLSAETSLTVSGGTLSVICVAPKQALFDYNGDTAAITYTNVYIENPLDLYLASLEKNYNDISEYANGYFSKSVRSRMLYLIDDVTVDKPTELNIPCSINLLNSVLTLNENLTIRHSYAGSYTIKTAAVNAAYGLSEGGVSIAAGKKLTLTVPKAYYTFAPSITASLDASDFSAVYDFDSYGSQLIDDALDFAESLIPDNIYSDIILQPSYGTYGVNYRYEIITGGSATVFNGAVSDEAQNGSLLRSSSTTAYTIRITAAKGALSGARDVAVNVVGTSAASAVGALKNDFTEKFVSASADDTTAYAFAASGNVDLKEFLSYFFRASSYGDTITVSVSETRNLPLSDENRAKIKFNSSQTDNLTLSYDFTYGYLASDGTRITSVYLAFGAVNVSDKITVSFSSSTETSSVTINAPSPSKPAVLSYLKNKAGAFTTNAAYSVLNLRDTDDDSVPDALCLGTETLTSDVLGLSSLSYNLYTLADGAYTEVLASSYFSMSDDNTTMTLLSNDINVPSNLYLAYSYVFSDGASGSFYIKVVKAMTSTGGDDQRFESYNPFDALFLNSDINWLIGGTFNVPNDESAEDYYAKIEITTVDDATYNFSTHRFCYMENGGNSVTDTNGVSYYKKISFVVDRNYVPAKNSLVKVKCRYYDKNAAAIILTQTYTITIHGIYKCGDNSTRPADYTPYVFSDENFYAMTVALFPSTYVCTFDDGTKYLLSDSSYASKTLDYTTLAAPSSAIDLTGIEKLVNVTAIKLDNIGISDMSAFGNFAESALTALSMKNCGITDAILYGGNAQSYLYNIDLVSVDLSQNAVISTDSLLSRTVVSLNLSRQTDGSLTDISGLENLYLLQTLDISRNAIFRFETLTKFSHLAEARVYGNRVTGAFSMYGTDGYLNIPYYVKLLKDGTVNIYANSADTTDTLSFTAKTTDALFSAGGDITPSMEEGSLALNALAVPKKLYSAAEKTYFENDINSLYVTENNSSGIYSGVTGGSDDTVEDTIYKFSFYNIVTFAETETMSLISLSANGYTTVTTVSGTVSAPVSVGYVITLKDADGNILAYREFIIDVHYSIN